MIPNCYYYVGYIYASKAYKRKNVGQMLRKTLIEEGWCNVMLTIGLCRRGTSRSQFSEPRNEVAAAQFLRRLHPLTVRISPFSLFNGRHLSRNEVDAICRLANRQQLMYVREQKIRSNKETNAFTSTIRFNGIQLEFTSLAYAHTDTYYYRKSCCCPSCCLRCWRVDTSKGAFIIAARVLMAEGISLLLWKEEAAYRDCWSESTHQDGFSLWQPDLWPPPRHILLLK